MVATVWPLASLIERDRHARQPLVSGGEVAAVVRIAEHEAGQAVGPDAAAKHFQGPAGGVDIVVDPTGPSSLAKGRAGAAGCHRAGGIRVGPIRPWQAGVVETGIVRQRHPGRGVNRRRVGDRDRSPGRSASMFTTNDVSVAPTETPVPPVTFTLVGLNASPAGMESRTATSYAVAAPAAFEKEIEK